MIVLAAVHLHPAISIALALAVFMVAAWYWHRLARPEVPPSRRRIRRISMVLVLLALPVLVAALSFVDPDGTSPERARYVNLWLLAIALLGLVVVIAVVDAVNNLKIISRQEEEAAADAAMELMDALEAAKRKAASHAPSRDRNEGPT